MIEIGINMAESEEIKDAAASKFEETMTSTTSVPKPTKTSVSSSLNEDSAVVVVGEANTPLACTTDTLGAGKDELSRTATHAMAETDNNAKSTLLYPEANVMSSADHVERVSAEGCDCVQSENVDLSEGEESDEERTPDDPDGLLKKLKKLLTKRKNKTKDSSSLVQEEIPIEKSEMTQGRLQPTESKAHVRETKAGEGFKTESTGAKPVPSGTAVHVSRRRDNTKRLPLATPVWYKPIQPPPVNPDVYDFNHTQRGYMVIIVNEKFMRQTDREGAHLDIIKAKSIALRLGYRILQPNKCRNLRKSETMAILREAQQMDHSKFDSFAFLMSSHGVEIRNPRRRGKMDHALVCADDQMIFTSTILEMFSEKNCPSLKGKPKLFFIQACRGNDVDDGGSISVAEVKIYDRASPLMFDGNSGDSRSRRDAYHRQKESRHRVSTDASDVKHSEDSWATETGRQQQFVATAHAQITVSGVQPGEDDIRFMDKPVGQQPSSIREPPRIAISEQRFSPQVTAAAGGSYVSQTEISYLHVKPFPINEAPLIQFDPDFLVMYAIPPGMFAWRNTTEGSWMIDYLDAAIKAYDMKRPRSFLKVLTQVSNAMSHRQTNVPSCPDIHAKKAVSVVESTLTKDIMFQNKVYLGIDSSDSMEYLTAV